MKINGTDSEDNIWWLFSSLKCELCIFLYEEIFASPFIAVSCMGKGLAGNFGLSFHRMIRSMSKFSWVDSCPVHCMPNNRAIDGYVQHETQHHNMDVHENYNVPTNEFD